MDQLPKIAQQRLQTSAKPGVHPDPDLLTAFVEKSLNDRERSQVLQHLTDCADCRDVIALALPDAAFPPSPVPQKSNWLSWPVLRWGALAACVVVVSTAVTLHYQRRQPIDTYVAEKTQSAPTSSAEIRIAQQPGEKLAAKAAPPAPFQSERDLAVASQLAKQKGRNLDSGRTDPAQPEVFALRAQNQEKENRDKKDELGNNRLADASADKSAGKPAGFEGMIAASPAPVPSAKPAQAAPAAEARNDSVNAPPGAVTETVTVDGAGASALEATQTPEQKAKDEATRNEARKEVQAAGAGAAGAIGGRKADSLSTTVEQSASGNYAKRSRAVYSPPRWTLSADGLPQRSFDSGKTWQTIPVASNVAFRALAANDSDVWVGGASGVLYHSPDAGQHWIRVYPTADGQHLTTDIVTVEFSDVQHGKLTTSNHETWITSNAGETWQKR
jgi:hypothetical protein